MLVVDRVSKRFQHDNQTVDVLRDVSLSVEEGEMVCVVGPSGAGKSTLLHLLGTLDLPSSGAIRFDGVDVTTLSSDMLAAFRNQRIGFVFQFHHLLPEFDALENVMMPGLIQGRPRAELKTKASRLLEEVGLSHRLTHRPGELSGGEQQRVALARALVMEPRLVLADEPTGNLDSNTSESVHDLFFELNRSRGTTFLVVTHNRDLAQRMPRMISMQDGHVVLDERRDPHATAAKSTDDVASMANDPQSPSSGIATSPENAPDDASEDEERANPEGRRVDPA